MPYRERSEEEIWAGLKAIQYQMALGGEEIPDAVLEKIALQIKNDPETKRLFNMIDRARAEGRDPTEGLEEYYQAECLPPEDGVH